MANGKPKDPYAKDYMEDYSALAGGNVGSQYLQQMKDKKQQISYMEDAAQALAGQPEKRRQAFAATKKDTLANLADESYRRRRTPIGAAITAAEQKRRFADRQFAAQEADMAVQALQDESVAAMAMAKVAETKLAQGMEAEKTLTFLSNVAAPFAENLKGTYDSFWDADEEGFFNSAVQYAQKLPPHMRAQFMDMYVMPQYRDWGGDRGNPFNPYDTANLGGPVAATGTPSAGGSSEATFEQIDAPEAPSL